MPLYILDSSNTGGELTVQTVPNNTGTVLTYNPTTKKVSTRTNTEIISDLGLNTNLTAYVKKIGDTMSGSLVFTNNTTGVISTVNDGTSTQWNAAYNTLNSVPRQGATGGTISSVRTSDTRNVNSLPSTDLASGVWFDFKSSSVIGLTGAGLYSAVITMIPYTDNSGNIGTAFRLAQSADEMYFQNYLSAGVWGSFRKFWTDKHFSQANITSWNNTASQLGNYIPLSQKATANGVATLDATVQIPNAQIPQRLLNKVIALGGENADTSFTGLYDRNQLTLADKDHTVTSVINGAGTFIGGMAVFNNTIFNAKSDFAVLTGTDATTEVVITITFSSVLSNYGRGYWQPFIQSRLQNSQMFRDISVEAMDNNNVWFPALTATNIVNIPGSGLYLFPESSFGTASIKSIRFKLSNAQTSSGIVYVSNIGFRHVSHIFAPQFPHRGENNKFFGVNDFSLSPTVPTATVANQAVNFGQISSKVNQSDLNNQLANYATLNGVQTFANTNTFTKSPLIPNATLLPHAVNLGTMSNAIEESEGNTIGYISNNFQTLNTPQNVGASKNYTHSFPFKFIKPNTKTWVLHKPSGNSLIFAPSTVVDSEDWDWANQISFNEDGSVTANKLKVRGGSANQFLKADGTLDASSYVTKNQVFSGNSPGELIISDSNFDEESGIVDIAYEVIVAGEENGYWKYGSNVGGVNGILIDKNTRRIGYGGVQPSGSYQHNFGGKVFTNDSVTSAGGFIHNDYNDPNKVLTSDGGVRDASSFGGLKASGILSGNIDVPDEVMNLDLVINGDAYLRLKPASSNQQGSKIVMKNLDNGGNFYIQINDVTLTNMSGNTRWEVVCYGTFWLVTTANGISFQI